MTSSMKLFDYISYILHFDLSHPRCTRMILHHFKPIFTAPGTSRNFFADNLDSSCLY